MRDKRNQVFLIQNADWGVIRAWGTSNKNFSKWDELYILWVNFCSIVLQSLPIKISIVISWIKNRIPCHLSRKQGHSNSYSFFSFSSSAEKRWGSRNPLQLLMDIAPRLFGTFLDAKLALGGPLGQFSCCVLLTDCHLEPTLRTLL